MNTSRFAGRTPVEFGSLPGSLPAALATTAGFRGQVVGLRPGIVLLAGYGLMWSLLHLCVYVSVHAGEESLVRSVWFYVWLGLLFGQLASVLMWPGDRGLADWGQQMFALGLIAVGSWLFSDLLTGSVTQWWVGLFTLMLGCKAAWWAMQRPGRKREAKRDVRTRRPPGAFSLSQWMVFSLWVAVASSLWAAVQADGPNSIAVLACFGGLSLFLTIQRFAFQQLFWPSYEYWPTPETPVVWRALDRMSVLGIILGMQVGLAWGLWQYYVTVDQAAPVLCLCLTAGWWQAGDLWFMKLVDANRSPTVYPSTAVSPNVALS